MSRRPIGVFAHSPSIQDPSRPRSVPRVWTSQVQMRQIPAQVGVISGGASQVQMVQGVNLLIPRHPLGPNDSVPISYHPHGGGIFSGMGAGPDGLG